jgi:hypothetical protein
MKGLRVTARRFSGAVKAPGEMVQFLQLTKVRQVDIDSTSPKYHTARVDREQSVASVIESMRHSYAGAVLVMDSRDGKSFCATFLWQKWKTRLLTLLKLRDVSASLRLGIWRGCCSKDPTCQCQWGKP